MPADEPGDRGGRAEVAPVDYFLYDVAMVFSSILTDRVTLVKKGGERFEKIRASVQSRMILTQDTRIRIEETDTFERTLPSGVVERYIVEDAGFTQGFEGMPSHYQSKVRKITARSSGTVERGPVTQVFNLSGSNPRVNIDSLDASTNTVNDEITALFEALRDAIAGSPLAEAAALPIVESVDAMESAVGTKTFTDRYKDFIQVGSNHMNLLAPFLPALTKLLAG